ncbi:MAG: flagellar hook-associated protein FlgK [Spirochaetales bacterium]|nr:flagellar hook-associated protein FlgK [Spirochaetales bacterium]
MQSAFTGIELGKRSLMAHTQGMYTVGHNMSNASTDGYSRQRVEMQPFDPIYLPGLNRAETAGQLGQGVSVTTIRRIRDVILEERIVAQANGQGYWEMRDKYLLMVEQVYNEPTDSSVRTLMDRFWESWQELSLFPSQFSARQAVLQRGQALIDGIHTRYEALKQVRDMLETDIKVTVGRVNTILDDIAGLNEQIVKIQAVGDNPNDLLDRRDLLVKELSGIIDITADNRDPDEFLIHTGGLHLVQGMQVHHLATEMDPLNDGYSSVVWQKSGEAAWFRGGSLASLVELRDGDVRGEIQKLDMMTVNFIDLVNEIHENAYGLTGTTNLPFFVEHPFINNLAGNYDRNGDGIYDSSYIFRMTGKNTLDSEEQIGLRGTIHLSAQSGTIRLDYFPTDTVGDVIKRINNAGAEVVARLNNDNMLTLKGTPAADPANPDFVIRYIEDTGSFLTGYAGLLLENGPAGAYTWERADAVLSLQGNGVQYAVAPLAHPSGWIEVNPTLMRDPGSVAAGFGENGRPAQAGDGRAALAIAQLRNTPVMVGRISSFDEYFAEVVADIGLKGEVAERSLQTEDLIMKELEDMRASISGVNIDEELSLMIKFQHGYSAASRFISEVDKMLDTIINRMGV